MHLPESSLANRLNLSQAGFGLDRPDWNRRYTGAEMCACLAATHAPGFGRERRSMSRLRLKGRWRVSNMRSTPGSAPVQCGAVRSIEILLCALRTRHNRNRQRKRAGRPVAMALLGRKKG